MNTFVIAIILTSSAMDKNTTNDLAGIRKLLRNTVVERDGRALCQLDENQWQTMEVP